MTDLTQIPTDTLVRMQNKLRTVMFVILGLDLVAMAVLVFLLMSPANRRMVPFLAPVLLLPTIGIVPVVGRVGAIGVELKRRA